MRSHDNGKGKGNGNGKGDSNSKRDGLGDGKGKGEGNSVQAAAAVEHCCCCCCYSAVAAPLLSCRSPILPVLLLFVCRSSGRLGVSGMRATEQWSSGAAVQRIYSSVRYIICRKCRSSRIHGLLRGILLVCWTNGPFFSPPNEM